MTTEEILKDIREKKCLRECYIHRIAQAQQTLNAYKGRLEKVEAELYQLSNLPAKIHAQEKETHYEPEPEHKNTITDV